MTDRKDQLEELLLAWEESRENGQDVSATELCRDFPELARPLQQRIDALCELDWLAAFQQSAALSFPSVEKRERLSEALVAGAEPVPGYRLVERIGRGGFSEVWKATGPGGMNVALKFVPLAEQAAKIEQRSLKMIKDVHHPHLLSILGAWHDAEMFVIGMELADKTVMKRWLEVCREGTPGIPREELLSYFRQAAEAIDHLNKHQLQHRDIKPQNLLLVGGQIKVADFGLVRLLSQTITGHTGLLTLAYAAPEFFAGNTSRHSDQYSLAVTWCQLRGGKLPFAGNPAETMSGHLTRTPDLSMLPKEERPAVERAMAKKPQQRWPSCGAFVEALETGAGAGLPFLRNRSALLWLGAAAAAVVLAALGAMFLWPADDVRPFPMLSEKQNVRGIAFAKLHAGRQNVIFLAGPPKAALIDFQTGKTIRTFGKVGGPCVALPPIDWRAGVAGFDDGSIVIWNLENGEELRWCIRPLDGSLNRMLASMVGMAGSCPIGAGPLLVTSSFCPDRIRNAHDKSVSSVKVPENARTILSGGCDNLVRLWNYKSGELIHEFSGHTNFVSSVAIDAENTRGLSGGWDKRVILWDLEKKKKLLEFKGHTAKVLAVDISSDGKYALSAGGDRTIRIWDLETKKELRTLNNFKEGVTSAVFCGPDFICSGGARTARIWSVATGAELCRSPEQPSAIQAVWPMRPKDSSQRYLLIGTSQHGLRAWKLPSLGK